jgi:hypothetical protein
MVAVRLLRLLLLLLLLLLLAPPLLLLLLEVVLGLLLPQVLLLALLLALALQASCMLFVLCCTWVQCVVHSAPHPWPAAPAGQHMQVSYTLSSKLAVLETWSAPGQFKEAGGSKGL